MRIIGLGKTQKLREIGNWSAKMVLSISTAKTKNMLLTNSMRDLGIWLFFLRVLSLLLTFLLAPCTNLNHTIGSHFELDNWFWRVLCREISKNNAINSWQFNTLKTQAFVYLTNQNDPDAWDNSIHQWIKRDTENSISFQDCKKRPNGWRFVLEVMSCWFGIPI